MLQYKHLKNASRPLIETLLEIFNESLSSSQVPRQWKTAQITMISKPNKPPQELKSYRPISLTSCLSKLMERCVLRRMTSFLEANKIIPDNQAGFRKGFSTDDHLFRLINSVINNFNKNKITGVVMFDIEKAFDRVWHDGLILKMQKFGMPNYIIKWIDSFIRNREFKVKYKETFSKPYKIKAGVPQGCICSPTLFAIYIADLSTLLKCENGKYSDDISIWKEGVSTSEIENFYRTTSKLSKTTAKHGASTRKPRI
jgi:hypothetical protein